MKTKLLTALVLAAASAAAFACPQGAGAPEVGPHATCHSIHASDEVRHDMTAGHKCGGHARETKATQPANSMVQWQAMADLVAKQIAPQLRESSTGWAVSLPEEGNPLFTQTFSSLLTSSLMAQGVPMAKKVDTSTGVIEIKLDSIRFANNIRPERPTGSRTGSVVASWVVDAMGVTVSPAGALSLGLVAWDVWELIQSQKPEPNAEVIVSVTAAQGNILKASVSDLFLVYAKDSSLYTPSAIEKLPTLNITNR